MNLCGPGTWVTDYGFACAGPTYMGSVTSDQNLRGTTEDALNKPA